MGPELRRLLDDEVAAAMAGLQGWQVVDGKLAREFRFANFVEAIDFIDRVAIEAEALDHHPEWSNVYNRVLVELWTHDVGGISALDSQLAHKMNELAQSKPAPGTAQTNWRELSRRCAKASHRLIGWIYWDPVGIANYAALGVPDGTGYYIATRAAPIANAGDGVVTAAFGSIHAGFIKFCLDLCRQHTTFSAAAEARDAAVVQGLHSYVPEITTGLAELAVPLWTVADALPVAGRTLFAAHRDWPRPDDPLLSAWLAVNCIREWRGDTHWAMQIADGLSSTASGVLDGAWRSYEGDWLPRSRGADDTALAAAYSELERRGLATGGGVDARGIAHRQLLEDQLDDLTATPWLQLGESLTQRFLELVEPMGARLVERIDATAGPNWMPAARDRRGPAPK